MIFCHKCGTQQTEDSAFCRKCGTKLIVENASAEAVEYKVEEQAKAQAETSSVEPVSVKTVDKSVEPNAPQEADALESNAEKSRTNEASSSDSLWESSEWNKYTLTPVSTRKSAFPVKIVVPIIAAVALIALVIVLIVVNQPKNNSESSTPSNNSSTSSSYTTSSETSATKIELGKTYTDAENGISFYYPSAWNVYNVHEQALFEIVDGTFENTNATITGLKFQWEDSNLMTYTDEQLKEDLKAELERTGAKNIKCTEISRPTISGIPMVRTVYSYTNPNDILLSCIQYTFNANKCGYAILFTCPTSKFSSYKQTFDNIMNSFIISEVRGGSSAGNLTSTGITTDVYGKDLLNMTIGEIKSRYGVTIDEQQFYQGPGAALVSFIDKNGEPWDFSVVVDDWFETLQDGIYAYPYVYDNATVDDVIFGQGALFNEKIYCGMTYDELKAVLGTEISRQEWYDYDGCYEASFVYFKNIGINVGIKWYRDPNGKSDSMNCYIYN